MNLYEFSRYMHDAHEVEIPIRTDGYDTCYHWMQNARAGNAPNPFVYIQDSDVIDGDNWSFAICYKGIYFKVEGYYDSYGAEVESSWSFTFVKPKEIVHIEYVTEG